MLVSIPLPAAPWSRLWARLRRRYLVARARVERRRREAAAREACAPEGASVEFQLIELGGRSFGAVYVDGKLNCLLPQVRSSL